VVVDKPGLKERTDTGYYDWAWHAADASKDPLGKKEADFVAIELDGEDGLWGFGGGGYTAVACSSPSEMRANAAQGCSRRAGYGRQNENLFTP
jgi:hypothetical protein